MTVARAAAVFLTFALIALSVVYLRGQQTRTTARTHDLRVTQHRLRQQSWELQMEIARLKTPDQIRDRVERWQLNVMAPCPGPGWRVDSTLAGAN